MKKRIYLKNKLEKTIESYANVVLSQSFIPNIEYTFAGFIWDSAPEITSELKMIVINILNGAIKKAKKCISYNIGTMGIFWYSKVVPAEQFINDVEHVIDKIKNSHEKDNKIVISLQAL